MLLQNIDKIFLDFKTVIMSIDDFAADDDEVNIIIEANVHTRPWIHS